MVRRDDGNTALAQVPRDEIPAGRDGRIDWLFAWWERIDSWIERNRPEPT